MSKLPPLLQSVSTARQQFIAAASNLNHAQTQYKPGADEWCVVDNVEHMVWAEMGAINGMWKTLEGIKNNKPIWTGDDIHQGLPIEDIIAKTWKEKEQVPEIAKPRWGGPVSYWIGALNNCQPLLEALCRAVDESGYDPEQIIYPHILSGPLNVVQRLEFLRFHLNRHQNQIERVKACAGFPQ